MTAHIVNRKIDPRGLPGTLSDSVITGILRRKIGFNGIIFSDDLQMEAISKQYSLEETIKLAITAGVDILLFCNNVPGSEERKVDAIHEIITKLVKDGTITPQRIDESYKRIMQAKKALSWDRAALTNEIMRLKAENHRLMQQTPVEKGKRDNEVPTIKSKEEPAKKTETAGKKSKHKSRSNK
jgi:beta-N-acetylhexosaminidase